MNLTAHQVTNYLLSFIAGLLLTKFYPETATLLWWLYIGGVVGWFLWSLLWTYIEPHTKRGKAEQRLEDRRWEWRARCEALRHKYDPNGEWNEITAVPQAFRDELKTINAEYADVESASYK